MVLSFCKNTIEVQESHYQLNREDELLKNSNVDQKLHQHLIYTYWLSMIAFIVIKGDKIISQK
jgi:hypothetical protein